MYKYPLLQRALLATFIVQILACGMNSHNINCDQISLAQSVFVISQKRNKVDYQINKNLIDISDSIGIEHWGPDEIKRYINNSDTLTLVWSYAYGKFNESYPIGGINSRLMRDSIKFISQNTQNYLSEHLKGVVSIVQYPKGARIIFYGLNEYTDLALFIDYKLKKTDKTIEDNFICMLTSFKFYPVRD